MTDHQDGFGQLAEIARLNRDLEQQMAFSKYLWQHIEGLVEMTGDTAEAGSYEGEYATWLSHRTHLS